MVPIKNLMAEKTARAEEVRCRWRSQITRQFTHGELRGAAMVEDPQNLQHVGSAREFIERNPQRVLIDESEIHAVSFGQLENFSRAPLAEFNAQGIKEILRRQFVTHASQPSR